MDIDAALDALDRVGYLLEEAQAPTPKVRAFRGAAALCRRLGPGAVDEHLADGTILSLPGIGPSTGGVIIDVANERPCAYLEALEVAHASRVETGAGVPGSALRALLRGDCHLHSEWSDGGSPIEAMARAGAALGHEYIVITDHSPRLRIANGLSAARLVRQREEIDRVDQLCAPFRVLAGIEVDILDDGSLDQDRGLLADLDLVVASVHSDLKMAAPAMTRRLCTALADPLVDVLGHMTNRIVVGKGRAESTFDADLVIEAARAFDTAIEINSRPERLDPPMRILELIRGAAVKVTIDTDAHAPGQLEWQRHGCARAERADLDPDTVVNSWPVPRLLTWVAAHRGLT